MNSCSKRRFDANTGRFVDQRKGGAGTSFAAFTSDMRSSRRLGSLNGRPNLQDAVKKGRLPDDVLSEVRRLKRSIVG
jgi:hypothetical protein